MVYHKKRVNRRWDYSKARRLIGYALLAVAASHRPAFLLRPRRKTLERGSGLPLDDFANAARRPARGEFQCPILYRRIFGNRSSLAKIAGTRGAKLTQPLAVCSGQIPAALARPGRVLCYAGGVPLDQFEFVNKLNIQRFQNLLETSLNDSERQIVQKLMMEEKAKQRVSGSIPKSE
jgi:hypothetical protein